MDQVASPDDYVLTAFQDAELFQRSIQSMPDILYVYDFTEERIIYCNGCAEQILGYTAEQIQGLKLGLHALANPGDGQPYRYEKLEDLSETDIIDYSFKAYHADGNQRWLGCREVIMERTDTGACRRLLGVARDISTIKYQEVSLSESEQRFRLLADGSPFFIRMVDSEGILEFANKACCSFFGIAQEHIRGEDWQLFLHPDDADSYLDDFSAAVTLRESWSGEARFRQYDNSWRWMVSQSTCNFSDSGEFLGCIGNSFDITEHHDAQAQLREYAHLLDHLDDAVVATDTDYRITAWNRGAEVNYGWQADEVIGRRVTDILNATLSEAERHSILTQLQSSGGCRFETYFEHRDGHQLCADVICTNVYDNGILSGTVAIVHDISHLKETQQALYTLNKTLEQQVEERTQALQRSEQLFSAAFYNAPVAACLLVLETRCFLEVNEAFEKVTGFSRAEAVANSDTALGLWSSQHDQQKLQGAIADGSFHDLELRIRTKDGRNRIICSSAQQISDNGSDILLKMFYDITERKRTEEQLLKAIQETMKDTSCFSQRVVEKLAQLTGERPSSTEIADLSPREQQVLARIANGMTNEEISQDLDIRNQTVRNYISTIYEKINVHSRAQAVVWARERGLQQFD